VVVLVLGLLGVGVLLAMVESDAGFARWDLSFTRFGAEHAAPWTTTVLRDVSRFGGYELVLAMGLATAVYGVWRSRRAAVVGFLVLALGGQFLVANSVKWAVDRPRPDLLNLTGFAGSSFPSGHATAAAATLMAMALVVGRDRSPRVRAVLAGLAAGGAVAVAATRVLLGVHWFTDVVAGLLLGWAWFALCSIAFGGSLLRFGAPVAEGEAVAAEIEREGDGRTASDVDA
jgi:undecaprenyl-diphosphatase